MDVATPQCVYLGRVQPLEVRDARLDRRYPLGSLLQPTCDSFKTDARTRRTSSTEMQEPATRKLDNEVAVPAHETCVHYGFEIDRHVWRRRPRLLRVHEVPILQLYMPLLPQASARQLLEHARLADETFVRVDHSRHVALGLLTSGTTPQGT